MALIREGNIKPKVQKPKVIKTKDLFKTDKKAWLKQQFAEIDKAAPKRTPAGSIFDLPPAMFQPYGGIGSELLDAAGRKQDAEIDALQERAKNSGPELMKEIDDLKKEYAGLTTPRPSVTLPYASTYASTPSPSGSGSPSTPSPELPASPQGPMPFLSLGRPIDLGLVNPPESDYTNLYGLNANLNPTVTTMGLPSMSVDNMRSLLGWLGKPKGDPKRKGTPGPEAYGELGVTGMSDQRGDAPFGLQSRLWEALGKANAQMKKEGLGMFGVSSGYRNFAEQKALYAKQPQQSVPAGMSVHGIGEAADLKLTPQQYNRLKEIAPDLGLVHDPSETWHWQLQPEEQK